MPSKINEYRKAIAFTLAPACLDTTNAALGLAGEAGEVAELVKKRRFQGRPYDRSKMLEELGDVLWYLDLMAQLHGFTLDYVAAANVEKLTARYPNGFVQGGGIR